MRGLYETIDGDYYKPMKMERSTLSILRMRVMMIDIKNDHFLKFSADFAET